MGKKVKLRCDFMELQVEKNDVHLLILGEKVLLSREVGIRLALRTFLEDEPTSLVGNVESLPTTKKRGCQSYASKKKLSASLKRYHARERRKAKAREAEKVPVQRRLPRTTGGSDSLMN